MIRATTGDIFESEAQTLVNTVNCVGVMGKGIALHFKRRFPDMYADYVARCADERVRLGKPYLFRRLLPPWVLNFPTKDHWRAVSRLSDIIAGLEYLEQHYREWGIASLAVPPLGCGQGQLEWRVVGPTLYRYLSRLDIPVELYAPHGTPDAELEAAFLSSAASESSASDPPGGMLRVNPAWVAMVAILARVEREPYHWPIGRTTFQKIVYFATELGLPTGLRYSRGSYGPFASGLKPLITRMVNNGLLREEQLGRMFAVKPGPTYPDAARTFRSQLDQWEPIIDRVADLFLRVRTNQAEVAATVFFAAQDLTRQTHTKPSEFEVFAAVKQWKQKRRPPLDEGEIASAVRNLNLLRWIDVRPSAELPVPDEMLVEA